MRPDSTTLRLVGGTVAIQFAGVRNLSRTRVPELVSGGATHVIRAAPARDACKERTVRDPKVSDALPYLPLSPRENARRRSLSQPERCFDGGSRHCSDLRITRWAPSRIAETCRGSA